MKQSIKIILWLAGAGIFIGLLAVQLRSSMKEREAEAKAAQTPTVVTVDVMEVKEQRRSAGFQAQGVTEPVREVEIGSEAAGKVTAVFFREGVRVAKGTVLAKLDVTQKNIELRTAQIQYEKAKSDYDKFLSLKSNNNATIDEVENAKLEMERLAHSIEALQQAIRESTVRASFKGTVTEKLIEPGMYLQPGSPVAVLVDVDSMKAVFSVDEVQVAALQQNQNVKLTLDALPSIKITGILRFVSDKADASGKFPVHVYFANTNGVKGGMSIHGRFNEQQFQQALMIPKSALVLNSSNPAVYVLEDNTARLQTVTLGNSFENLVEVREGLKPHTRIVVRGVENVIDGMDVNIKEKVAINF